MAGGISLTPPVFLLHRSWFEGQELVGKLRAIQTVSCLLQGPSDAGNRVLELEGIMDSVLSLCASVREAHQLVAVEALIHAADKAKRASFITANGVSLLKEIYKHSERDSIRIRALVVSTPRLLLGRGCRFLVCSAVPSVPRGSWALLLAAGALQAGICRRHRLQHEAVCRGLHTEAGQAVPQVSGGAGRGGGGAAAMLMALCRWLCNEAMDVGTRRWAVEGLAYLTFDADVKEEFVEDKAAMQAMFHLAKVRARRCGGLPALQKCAPGGCGAHALGLGSVEAPGGAGWTQGLACSLHRGCDGCPVTPAVRGQECALRCRLHPGELHQQLRP